MLTTLHRIPQILMLVLLSHALLVNFLLSKIRARQPGGERTTTRRNQSTVLMDISRIV